jgi:FkbM family methyltransferase
MSVLTKLAGLRQVWRFDNRWHLLLSRLLFRADSVLLYRLDSLEFLVDHAGGDPNGAPEVLTRPMYADHIAHLRFDHPVNVLDIGANNGGFALFLLHHAIVPKRIVSVELNPRTCTRLRYNLERNLPARSHVINAALCGVPRQLELALGDGCVSDSIYGSSWNAASSTTRVEGLTFDELYDRNFPGEIVDICKIDVEQAEYEVMENPGHDRMRSCRLLVVEIHEVEGRSRQDVAGAIVGLGFEELPRRSDPGVYVFRNRSPVAPPLPRPDLPRPATP